MHDHADGLGRREGRGCSRRAFIRRSVSATAGLVGGWPHLLTATEGPDTAVIPTLDESYAFHCPELVEITEPGRVVLPDGTSLCSWSRMPYLDLNFEDASFFPIRAAQRLQMKKWEMYHVVTPTHYVIFLVAWIGYASFCTAHVYTRATRTYVEDIHIRGAYPETPMMRTSAAGRTAFASKRARMTFDVEGPQRRLRVDWPGFADVDLTASVDLHLPTDHETICATHPVHAKRAFYSRKINCMTASGELRLGGETVRFRPQDCFGMLDYGRGYYPHKTFWYWATASGRDDDGELVGFNLGHGNHRRAVGENAVFHAGRTHKIGLVRCDVPKGDYSQPWRVRADDGRVDLALTVEKVRRTELDLGWIHTIGRPVYGRYNGHVTLDSGKVVKIKDLFGLYEWFDQQW